MSAPRPQAPLAQAEAPRLEPLLLSASIYCEGLIDEVLQHALAPFWKQAKASEGGARLRLWMLRYTRLGLHLKVRIHGPPGAREALRQALSEAVEPYLSTLGAAEPGQPRSMGELLSPLDPEDEGSTAWPDRTLRWTHYQPVPAHLGREPLAAAPGFVEGALLCLAEAAEVTLERLVPGNSQGVRPGLRTTLLTRLAMAALEALALRPEEELEYLLFHRDWLLAGARSGHDKALAVLDQRAAREGALLERLGAASARRHESGTPPDTSEELVAWRRAISHHFRHALGVLGAGPLGALGPEPRHQLLSAVARVLHNTANLLGLDTSNEIYVFHLLGRSLRPLLGPEAPQGSWLVNPASARQP